MKKFTLIELIVAITVMGILLTIIMLNFFDLKKKTVTSTMSQNISIMQGMVDTYYIKENEYPIKNQSSLTLENPQLIDIDMLLDKSIQKKDLDLSKISEQYYWVDVFGKVWGSTKNSVKHIALIEKETNQYNLEALVEKDYVGYHIYEISGYSLSSTRNANLEANSENLKKSYRMIGEYSMELDKEKLINHEFEGKGSQYLFSFIDEYGLETAPMGKSFNNHSFNPIIRGEGEYEFEIEGEDTMYWIDFITLEDTPGKSTIEYLFTVKGENGEYNETWTNDYFSLDPSKGIKVKVIMKGDDEGNKPSLYDLHILFKYEDEDVPFVKVEEYDPEDFKNETCPQTPNSSFNRYSSTLENGDKGTLVYGFYIEETETMGTSNIPKISLGNNLKYKVISTDYYISMDGVSYEKYNTQEEFGKCMYVSYEIEVISVKEPETNYEDLCGNGKLYTHKSGNELQIVYSLYLEEGEYLNTINKPSTYPNWIYASTMVQVSHNKEDFKKVTSLSEIKDESCVQVVFKYKSVIGYPELPPVNFETCIGVDCVLEKCLEDCIPVCKENCETKQEPSWCELYPTEPSCNPYCVEVPTGCIPPICSQDCSTSPPSGPSKGDAELEDPEWKTVERLNFFGHGAVGQLTRWYRSEHKDSINTEASSEEISLSLDENTRIVYRYTKSSGTYWSSEYKDFTTTEYATRVMAVAYIQVKTNMFDTISETDYPKVSSIKFYNEKGVLDLSMVNPTVVVLAEKDNNIGREVFSNESNIVWDYEAADPRNKKITKVEWDGDIRSKYPVGTYQVKVRVQNEMAYWSDWSVFEFEVKEEKPVAVITTDSNVYYKNSDVKWFSNKSYDPDGDKIVKMEWSGDKRSSYEKDGSYSIGLRVQDSEGYWSEWTNYELTISSEAYNIYRLEAEDKERVPFTYYSTSTAAPLDNELGAYVITPSDYVQFEFEGNGFDISLKSPHKSDWAVDVHIDDKVIEYKNENNSNLISIRNLKLEKHVVKVYINRNHVDTRNFGLTVDYLDVYSSNDTPVLLDSYPRKISSQNIEQTFDNNEFTPAVNETLKLNYELLKNVTGFVQIKDSEGKVVRTYKEKSKFLGGSAGKGYLLLDGRDSQGELLKGGSYTAEFIFTGVNKTPKTFVEKFVVFSNLVATNVEAEDPKRVKFQHYSLNTENRFSNSKALYLILGSNYAEFEFEGNGFELNLVSNPINYKVDVMISIDGETEFEAAGNVLVRGLKEGKHTVKIRIKNPSNAYGLYVDSLNVYSSIDKPEFIEIKTRQIDNINNEKDFNSNTFSPAIKEKLKLYYNPTKNSKISVVVLDDKGSKIKDLLTETSHIGTRPTEYTLVWDGKDSSGNIVKDGNYTMRIRGVGQEGSVTVKDLEIKTTGSNESYRIEAEDTALVPNTYYTATVNSKFSNGKAAYIVRSTDYVEFKFKGHSFQLIAENYPEPVNVSLRLVLDGDTNNPINSIGNTSITGLKDEEHTLRVYVLYPSNAYAANIDYLSVFTGDNKVEVIKTAQKNVNSQGIEQSYTTEFFRPDKGEKMKFYYNLSRNSITSVDIVDKDNKVVKVIKSKVDEVSNKPSGYIMTWDGKDDSGKVVVNGEYSLRLKTTSISGEDTMKTFKIKASTNSEFVERIEAEDMPFTYYHKSSSSVYSNGLAAYVILNGNYVEFTFEGQGFDMGVIPLTLAVSLPMNVEVDGVLMNDFSPQGNFSVRGLSSGTHKVKVYFNNPSTRDYALNVDYLDVFK